MLLNYLVFFLYFLSSFVCQAGWPTLCQVNLEKCLYFSMAELKILSFNVQGLGGIKKQKDVFNYLLQNTTSICAKALIDI